MKSLLAALALLLAACPGPAKAPAPPTPGPGSDEPTPAAEESFDLEDNHLTLPSPIVFVAGTAEIDMASSEDALQHILAFMKAKDSVTLVRIEGHTDGESGPDGDRDVYFSGERALTVARWLTAWGVDCERLIVAAFGDWKPIADNSTSEGKAQNSRIEVVVAALRGTLIGGMPADGDAPAAAPACD